MKSGKKVRSTNLDDVLITEHSKIDTSTFLLFKATLKSKTTEIKNLEQSLTQLFEDRLFF